MYRTNIEQLGEKVNVSRWHSTNPEVAPYKLVDSAPFPSEKALRILQAGNVSAAMTPEGKPEFRQESE